jgi:hypothetical protein
MVGGTVNLNETCVGVLTGTSSVDQMKLDGGNNNVTTADGMMGNCTSWGGSNTLNIGAGGVQGPFRVATARHGR